MKPTKAIRKVEGWYIRLAIWNKNRRMRKARMLEEVMNDGAPEC